MNSPQIVVVIPARYGSSRLPGKPLVSLAGKPMIQRVYERAKMAKRADRVIVATGWDPGDLGIEHVLVDPATLEVTMTAAVPG